MSLNYIYKEDKMKKLIYIIIAALLIIGSYKWQEWKLENIWGIQNPSFFQVWDSIGRK